MLFSSLPLKFAYKLMVDGLQLNQTETITFYVLDANVVVKM